MVETVNEPRQTGYVPSNFLVAVAAADGSSGHAAGPVSAEPDVAEFSHEASASPAGAAAAGHASREVYGAQGGASAGTSPARSAAGGYGQESYALATMPGAGAGPAELASPAAASAAMKSEEFAHLFEAHDQWFRQALSRRQETFKALTSSVGELNRKLLDGEGKAKSLADRLGKLEAIVEAERKRWTDQLEKERTALGEAGALVE